MKMKRVLGALLSVLMVFASLPVQAEETAPSVFFLDAAEEMYRAGGTVSLSGTVSLKKASDLTDSAKELINRLLENTMLSLSFSPSAYAFTFAWDGEEYLNVSEAETENGCVTSVNGYTAGSGERFFEAETGDIPSFTGYSAAAEQIAALVRGAYDGLVPDGEGTEKTDRSRFTYGGKSRTRTDFVLSDQNAEMIFSPAAEAVRSACPESPLSGMLDRLCFTGNTVLSVYRAENGACCAVTVKGMAAVNGREAALSFRAETGESGTAFSCSLTGTEDKDSCLCSLAIGEERTETALTRTLTAKTEEKTNGKKKSRETSLRLKERVKDDGSSVAGSVTVTDTDGNKTEKRTFMPELTVNGGSGNGTVAFSRKTGETVTVSGTVTLASFSVNGLPVSCGAGNMPDMKQDPDIAYLLLEGEALKGMTRWLSVLPEKDFQLFTHEMRTEEWTEFISSRGLTPSDWAVE